MLQIKDLRGLWRRSMITRPDGRRDSTTRVCWLQGIGMYADLRQPADLPAFAGAAGLNQLSMQDCEQLARQEGFAGRLRFDGRHFEWARRIDLQPKSAVADAGSLEWDAGVLTERGRDVDYIEHWHREEAVDHPCAALLLRASGSLVTAILLRVGGAFMFARDRAAALPPGRTLSDCVAAAPSVQAARSLIDCEISAGIVESGGFRITASTLPHRRGHLLGQRVLEHTATTAEPDSRTVRNWRIIEFEGERDAL